MKIQFLGAVHTVTGSQFLVTTDRSRVLIDCGMHQGSHEETELNELAFAYDPASIDAVLLTHAHLDHCGLIPLLVKRGFRGRIWATAATVELTRLVLLDSGRLQEEHASIRARRARQRASRRVRAEAEREHRDAERRAQEQGASGVVYVAVPEEEASAVPTSHRPQPRVDGDAYAPLYTEADANAAMRQFCGVAYREPVDVAPGVRATFVNAGHILGSAIISVVAADSDGEPRHIVFSGDLGRPNAPIIRDPTIVRTGADYVVVETTYGGREHEPAEEATRILAETVRLVAEHSGVLLIPAFAIGRTQEIVWTLDRLLEAGHIPHVPLFLDSPMAQHATEVYRDYPEYYDRHTKALLEAGVSPLDYPGQVVTRSGRQSHQIARAPRPMMIVASNGMLTGGRVLGHLVRLVGDPDAVVLLVGYQGEGTLGRALQNGARKVKIEGVTRQVRCQVRNIGGFSAHADEPELVAWLRHFAENEPRPRKVFLVHGEPDAQEAMAARIRELGLEPHAPGLHETIEI